MNRRESFAYDPENHKPHECWRWCKVHWYWDFKEEDHILLPAEFYYQDGPPVNGKRQWVSVVVHVGPPGYCPKKPRPDQWQNMFMRCPHHQGDLTCNTCLRHSFRLLEI